MPAGHMPVFRLLGVNFEVKFGTEEHVTVLWWCAKFHPDWGREELGIAIMSVLQQLVDA